MLSQIFSSINLTIQLQKHADEEGLEGRVDRSD
jgi:hypothetical protein